MKLLDTILLYTSIGLFIIGFYEVISGSFIKNHSYWIFMLMISLIFWYGYRKIQQKPDASLYFDKKEKKDTQTPMKGKKTK